MFSCQIGSGGYLWPVWLSAHPRAKAPTVAVPVRLALTGCQGCSCVSPWTVIPILPSRKLQLSEVP